MFEESGPAVPTKYWHYMRALGSLLQPSALGKSDVVESTLMLPSTPSNRMTDIQAPVRLSSSAELDTEKGRLVFW
jgi:hypothetical protein